MLIYILIYRDGVSEGQMPQVMHYEIEAIRDAYKNKYKCDIEITCLIVQKRHHVRLFPTRNSQNQIISDDTNGNVKAGTIVDSEITHPSHFDFYLVSHASIQVKLLVTKICLYITININFNIRKILNILIEQIIIIN